MAKENTLEFSGEVIELLKNAMFRVKLSNGHTIICHSAGKIRKNRIRILQGDTVKVSVSPYDLTRGIIVFRGLWRIFISKLSLGSSGVEQSPEKACVGGANPSRGTTKSLKYN